MNIHRYFVVLESAAIPVGHLSQTNSTFLFYLSYWLFSATVCLCLENAGFSKNISFNQPVHVESIMHIHKYIQHINCRCMHWNLCSRKRGPAFFHVHVGWWLLHGPSALKHKNSNMACCLISNINVWINQKKISIYNIIECTTWHLLFCSFPNTVEKCWSVYHLVDICSDTPSLWDNRGIKL